MNILFWRLAENGCNPKGILSPAVTNSNWIVYLCCIKQQFYAVPSGKYRMKFTLEDFLLFDQLFTEHSRTFT
jgi:hypothetical protein